MIHAVSLLAALAAAPSAGVTGPAGPIVAGPPDGQQAVRRPPKVEAVQQCCSGTVLVVTKDSITIQQDDAPRRRQFAASAVLAAGGYRRPSLPCDRYKLADVQVGDKVGIEYSRVDGIDICEAISIGRRPGGRVPPAHDPDPGTHPQHHEYANADQDFEERGIPLPDRFVPGWELDARRAKIAPMPRVAVPRIPPAAP